MKIFRSLNRQFPTKNHSLRGLSVGLVLALPSLAAATEIQFAGYATDTPEWRQPTAENHPAGEASGMTLSGWTLFGGGTPFAGELDADTRMENLPAFISEVSAAEDAKVYNLASYSEIQSPDDREAKVSSGTVSVNTDKPVDLIRIKLGKDVPDLWRLGVLMDNLDNPSYAALELRVVADGVESDPVMTSAGAGIANNKPDWYFWDIRGAEDGDEIAIRVSPNHGVATLGGAIFLSDSPAQAPRNIGQFSHEGEYVKDYYVYKEGDTYHLFYNVGTASKTQSWEEPGNEKAFGHATSKDLKTWTSHPRVLETIPGTWEGQVVSAPSIIKHGDTYYMTYTGFDDRVTGKQAIGLATSKDLFTWERYAGNPVYEAPPWTIRNPSGWLDCRDAHIIKYGDEFLLFTMVTTDKGQGAIALASSSDLKTWKDLGPAVITFTTPESPRVFEHKGTYYMFATSGHGKILLKTKDPTSNKWEEIPFRWPAPGLWSGWEVVQDGDRTIFSAFEWKLDGNFIRFWDVDWDGETPVVRY